MGHMGKGHASSGGWSWAARGARARATSQHSCALAWTFCWFLFERVSPKFCTEVHQVMNRKVVDLAILYNFHKGYIVFFSIDLAGVACQL
jgi:hypothetical protein